MVIQWFSVIGPVYSYLPSSWSPTHSGTWHYLLNGGGGGGGRMWSGSVKVVAEDRILPRGYGADLTHSGGRSSPKSKDKHDGIRGAAGRNGVPLECQEEQFADSNWC